MANIDNAQISMGVLFMKNAFATREDLTSRIIQYYKMQAIKEVCAFDQ